MLQGPGGREYFALDGAGRCAGDAIGPCNRVDTFNAYSPNVWNLFPALVAMQMWRANFLNCARRVKRTQGVFMNLALLARLPAERMPSVRLP